MQTFPRKSMNPISLNFSKLEFTARRRLWFKRISSSSMFVEKSSSSNTTNSLSLKSQNLILSMFEKMFGWSFLIKLPPNERISRLNKSKNVSLGKNSISLKRKSKVTKFVMPIKFFRDTKRTRDDGT